MVSTQPRKKHSSLASLQGGLLLVALFHLCFHQLSYGSPAAPTISSKTGSTDAVGESTGAVAPDHVRGEADHTIQTIDESAFVEKLRLRADSYYRQSLWAAAQPLYEVCLAKQAAIYGTEHQELDPVLDRLAIISLSESQFTAADRYIRRLFVIRSKALQPNDRDYVDVNDMVASLLQHYDQVRDLSAYASLQELVLDHAPNESIANAALQQSYEVTARELNSQHWNECRPLLDLLVRREHKDPTRRSYALHYLAYLPFQLHEKNPNVERSEQMLTEAIALRDKAGQYRNEISSLDILAAVEIRGRHSPERAEQQYRKALKLWDREHVSDIHGKGVEYYELGTVLRQQSRNAEAEIAYNQALRLLDPVANKVYVEAVNKELAELAMQTKRRM